MDQRNNGPVLQPRNPTLPENEESFISPMKIFSVLGRHKTLAGAIAAGTLLCAAAFIMTLKPYYEATSEIMIGARGMISPSQLQPYTDQAVDLVGLNTQLGVLKSPAIARMVTRQLHLENNPEYRHALEPSGLARFKQKLGLQHPGAPLTDAQREDLITAILMGKVRIVNDGRSAIIAIAARAATPELSAQLANAYANAYFGFERQAKIESARQASSMLEEQIAPLRERVLLAEHAVSRYREEHNLNLIGSDDSYGNTGNDHTVLPTTSNALRLTQMNHELGDAEADLARKESMAAQAAAAAASGNAATLSTVTNSPLIQGLLLQQAQINARISTLSATALDRNPELIAARAQSARLSRQIAAENQKILYGLQYDAQEARKRVRAIKLRTDTLQSNATVENHADVRLRQLVSEASAAQTVYRDYLSRLTQISAETSIQQAEARLVDAASIPLGPAGPPKKQYAIMALIVAAGLGVGAALLRDRSRHGIRTLVEVQQRTYLFGLGMLPALRCPLRQQFEKGPSNYGQMINSIRNILTFGHEAVRTRTVVITSAEAGEGKTTLAVSLAASIGMQGKRALVIDCDPHNPSVLRTCGVNGTSTGFVQGAIHGVDVYVPSYADNHGALNFSALKEFIDAHVDNYEKIIIDTPPVLSFPEAGIISTFAEGVIIAIKWQSTDASTVIDAQKTLYTYQARCLGAVLTCVDVANLRNEEGNRMGVYARNPLLTSP